MIETPPSDTAVVTGAGSGIGRATARALAADGTRVVVADLDGSAADVVARQLEDDGLEATGVEVDITDRSSVTRLREHAEQAFGLVNVVVNCAGWGVVERFLDNAPETWDRVIAVNYTGTVNVCHEFVGALVHQERDGRIVNVASDAGRVGSSHETVYAGAKGGVIAFSKSLAREVARHRIAVNCVSPGPTDTPMFANQPEKGQQALIRAIPFRRLAQPEEIAAAIRFFASDQSSYVTGQVLSVSGGLTMVD